VPLSHVVVAGGRGHVLAFDGMRCRNFTINGTPIGEKVYHAEVSGVCVVRENFAMITADGELAIYDAETLEKVNVVYRSDVGLVAVKFRQCLNLLVCIRADGSIALAFINL
jgi:hypothetical protein